MRKILLMAKRDYIASVTNKAFILGLIVAPLLFGGGFLAMAIARKKPDLRDKRIAVIDHTGAAARFLIRAAQEKNEKELYAKGTTQQIAPRYVFEVPSASGDDHKAERLALSERIRKHELFAFLEIWPSALEPQPEAAQKDEKTPPRIAFYTNASGMDETRGWLRDPINRALREVHLARLGVPSERQPVLLQSIAIEPLSLLSRDPKTGALQEAKKKDEIQEFAAPFGLVMLLTMIVMIGAAPMLSAVTEDKNQRIFEMLLGLATPFEIMASRVLAALGRSLTSSAFYIIGAVLVLQGMSMIGVVQFELLPWFFLYLIAHVTMLCSLASALGAACSSPQEAQNLSVVLFAPIMIPYFLLVPVMQAPNGALATVISLIPPFTPPMMLLRQALPGGVPWWQPWIGVAGVILWTIFATWAASRIFRVAILMQGQGPKIAEMMRWAVRG
jgi:ABC-2 type transport system permease protein